MTCDELLTWAEIVHGFEYCRRCAIARARRAKGKHPSKARPDTPTLIEEIDELMADVPQSVWNDIPPDLVRNFDHYLYGAPKERLRGHDDVTKELG